MITISSENNLLSQVLAMTLLFILPSNLYHTQIPHKLGLFCRNLAFLTCDWQYLVWRGFVLLLPCPKKSDKMWTLSELSELSESIVQKESFPSARCLRQKAERGRAGFKREGGRGGDRAIGGVALEHTQLPLHLQLEREVALHCSSDFAEVLWF